MSTRRQQTLAQQATTHAQDALPYSNELKQQATLNVRFDKRTREALIREEAINDYQQNAYSLGRVFSNAPIKSWWAPSDADFAAATQEL